MKRILTALALGAAMLGVAACGGDDNSDGDTRARDEFTLVDYFSTYEDINSAAEEQFDSITPDIGGADASLDERKSALVTFLKEIRNIADEIVAEFEAIEPPDEAQALHDDSLQAGSDLVEAIDGIIAEVEDFDSLSDILDFDVPELDAANKRLDAVCADLQKLADDEEIDVNLGCD